MPFNRPSVFPFALEPRDDVIVVPEAPARNTLIATRFVSLYHFCFRRTRPCCRARSTTRLGTLSATTRPDQLGGHRWVPSPPTVARPNDDRGGCRSNASVIVLDRLVADKVPSRVVDRARQHGRGLRSRSGKRIQSASRSKVLRPELGDNDDIVARFQREGKRSAVEASQISSSCSRSGDSTTGRVGSRRSSSRVLSLRIGDGRVVSSRPKARAGESSGRCSDALGHAHAVGSCIAMSNRRTSCSSTAETPGEDF